MKASRSYKPEGFHDVVPYLVVTLGTAEKLIRFLVEGFGGKESEHRSTTPEGRLMHTQVQLGDSAVELGETDDPAKVARMFLRYFVPDVDSVHQRAVAAGATVVMEPADQFYGERSSGVTDPCGNTWWISKQIEELSFEEIEERAKKMGKG
ncbi:MAG: VOC family protein [Acidobacteriaceae bacterium]